MSFMSRDKLPGAGIGDVPALVLMCAPSRVGKTRTANALASQQGGVDFLIGHHTVVFGMDDVRRCMGDQYNLAHEPVVRMAKTYAIGALIHRGYNVIADCTHLTRASRKDTRMFITAMVPCRPVVCAIRMPEGDDAKRWHQAIRAEHFPEEVVAMQMARYERPTEDEGCPVHWFPHYHDEETTRYVPRD